jgi:hypothetical protein
MEDPPAGPSDVHHHGSGGFSKMLSRHGGRDPLTSFYTALGGLDSCGVAASTNALLVLSNRNQDARMCVAVALASRAWQQNGLAIQLTGLEG